MRKVFVVILLFVASFAVAGDIGYSASSSAPAAGDYVSASALVKGCTLPVYGELIGEPAAPAVPITAFRITGEIEPKSVAIECDSTGWTEAGTTDGLFFIAETTTYGFSSPGEGYPAGFFFDFGSDYFVSRSWTIAEKTPATATSFRSNVLFEGDLWIALPIESAPADLEGVCRITISGIRRTPTGSIVGLDSLGACVTHATPPVG